MENTYNILFTTHYLHAEYEILIDTLNISPKVLLKDSLLWIKKCYEINNKVKLSQPKVHQIIF